VTCGAHPLPSDVIVCSHIVYEQAPLYRVVHENDGSWQMLCEHGSHDSVKQVTFACLSCFRERHPEFEVVAGLYVGGMATKLKDDPGRWWVEPMKSSEE
jgi:hypothetical protein